LATRLKSRSKIQAPVDLVLQLLEQQYPGAHCELFHRNPFELLIATVLSAQCTDERVNKVTPALFERFPDPESMSKADLKELEELVRSTGFFKNKAKNIKSLAVDLVRLHGGQVPKEMESLTALSGVGRKTANVILGNAFGLTTGVVVDTHVGRLSRRWGWTRSEDPQKVEQDLMRLIPSERWVRLSHEMIFHGRRVCSARGPKCSSCYMSEICPQLSLV
jgi:endonuclease-3